MGKPKKLVSDVSSSGSISISSSNNNKTDGFTSKGRRQVGEHLFPLTSLYLGDCHKMAPNLGKVSPPPTPLNHFRKYSYQFQVLSIDSRANEVGNQD